jgi:hypothetical protein
MTDHVYDLGATAAPKLDEERDFKQEMLSLITELKDVSQKVYTSSKTTVRNSYKK